MALDGFGINESHPTGLAEFEGELYMVAQGDTSTSGNSRTRKAALYTVDALTGAGTRVNADSAADDFGVGEELPTGLVVHGTKMYMVGETHQHLFELNPSTGIGTAVRQLSSNMASAGFGVSETTPTGLCNHNGVMYMVGEAQDKLYTLNLETGEATRVGNATNFGLNGLTIKDLTSDGTTLYGLGTRSGRRNGLYKIYTADNPTEGHDAGEAFFIPVWFSGFRNSRESQPRGIATDGTTTWMVGAWQKYLSTINLETGAGERVGRSAEFGLSLDDPADLEYNDSALYMVDDTTKRLYTLNTSTGAATSRGRLRVGSTNITDTIGALGGTSTGKLLLGVNGTTTGGGFGVAEDNPTSIATNGATMWMVGDDQDRLYTLALTNTKVDLTLASSVSGLTTSNVEFSANTISLPGSLAASTITGSGTSWQVTFSSALTNFQLADMTIYISSNKMRVVLTGVASYLNGTELIFNSGLAGGSTGVRGITVTGTSEVGVSRGQQTDTWDITFSQNLRADEFASFNMDLPGRSITVRSISYVARNINLAALEGSTTTETVTEVGSSVTNFGLGAGTAKATGITYVGTLAAGTLYMVAEFDPDGSAPLNRRFYAVKTRSGQTSTPFASSTALGAAVRVGSANLTAVGDLANDGTDIWMVTGGNTFGKITTAGVYSASRNTQHGLTNVTGLTNSGDINQGRVYAITSTSSQNGTLYSTGLGNGQVKLTFNKIIGGFATANLTLGGLAGRSITDAQPAATLPTAEWIITLDQAITNSQVTAAGTTFTLASAITGTRFLRLTLSGTAQNLTTNNFNVSATPSGTYTLQSVGPVGTQPTNEWYLEFNNTFNDSQASSFTIGMESNIVRFVFTSGTTFTAVSGQPVGVSVNSITSNIGASASREWNVEFSRYLTNSEVTGATWNPTVSNTATLQRTESVAKLTVTTSPDSRQALGKGATVSSKTNLYANTRHGSANAVGVANTRGLLNPNRTSPPNKQGGLYMVSSTNNGTVYRVDETGGTAAIQIAGGHTRDVTNFYTVNTTDASLTAITNTTHGLSHVYGLTQLDAGGNLFGALVRRSGSSTFYTFNPGVDGAATQLGTGTVSSDTINSICNTNYQLAADSDSIYMVGEDDDGDLYRLQYTGTNRGQILDQISPAMDFGFYQSSDRETLPQGIAWGNNTMYMVGQRSTGGTLGTVYVLDKATGRALAASNLGTAQTPLSLMHLEENGTHKLYYFNNDSPPRLQSTTLTGSGASTTFGSAARVASSSISNEEFPRGFDHIRINNEDRFYAVGQQHDKLYRVDLTDGMLYPIDIGPGFGTVNVTDPKAMVSNTLNLYLFGPAALYTLNLDADNLDGGTGLGTATLARSYAGTLSVGGAAYKDGSMYITDDATDTLRTFTTSSGASSQVGSATDFGIDEEIPRGLAFINNLLYMVGQTNERLYLMDLNTGVAGSLDPLGEYEDKLSIFVEQVMNRFMHCLAAPGEVGDGDLQFNPENVHRHLAVSLAGPPTTNTGPPLVRVIQGDSSNAERVFGKFIGISGPGNNPLLTIAISGESMIFNRGVNVPAVTAADIGKGIMGSSTDNEDGIVVAVNRSATSRGTIIGGNMEDTDYETNGYFVVSF